MPLRTVVCAVDSGDASLEPFPGGGASLFVFGGRGIKGELVQAAYAAQLPVYCVKAISDVAGSGSTTEQFLINKDKALQNLKAALPVIFEEL